MATATKRKTRAGKYRWAKGKRFRVPAAVAGTAVEAIRRRDGACTPAVLVAEAASPHHPLHTAFCWDDDIAAQRWREHTARNLINSIRITVSTDDGPEERVAFVSVTTRDNGKAYLPIHAVMSDCDYRAEAVAEALAALDGWRRRYGHLRALARIFDAIDAARD